MTQHELQNMGGARLWDGEAINEDFRGRERAAGAAGGQGRAALQPGRAGGRALRLADGVHALPALAPREPSC
jgi:hypothetical protein